MIMSEPIKQVETVLKNEDVICKNPFNYQMAFA